MKKVEEEVEVGEINRHKKVSCLCRSTLSKVNECIQMEVHTVSTILFQ
jgi:hypothetical protein